MLLHAGGWAPAGTVPAISIAHYYTCTQCLLAYAQSAAIMLLHAGGWVPSGTGPAISIPSRDVMFINNLIVNPTNQSAMWAHFSVSDVAFARIFELHVQAFVVQ
jgi:hypothetical protein